MSDENQSQDDEWFNKWNQRFRLFNLVGLPTILLFAVCYFARDGVITMAKWAQPIIEKMVSTHVEAIIKIQETQDEIKKTNDSIARSMEKQVENGSEFVNIAKRQQEAADGIAKKVTEIHNVIVKPNKGGGD